MTELYGIFITDQTSYQQVNHVLHSKLHHWLVATNNFSSFNNRHENVYDITSINTPEVLLFSLLHPSVLYLNITTVLFYQGCIYTNS